MEQRFECPGCGTAYPFNGKLLGKRVKCKKCDQVFFARRSTVSTEAPDGLPALGDMTSENLIDDAMGESLPPAEDALPQSSLKMARLSSSASKGTSLFQKTGSTKLTKMESSALYYGGGMFVVGILLMFGINLGSRGRRIRKRLSGEGTSPAGPAMQLIGLLMALVSVGVVGFALRRRLHLALPVGAGMLLLLGVSYMYSPLHRSRAAVAPQPTVTPSPPPPAPNAPIAPAPPRSVGGPQPGAPAAPSFTSAARIDLLQEVDLQRDAVSGQWSLNQSAIESDGGRSILAFPVTPPEEYRWTVMLERVAGNGGINLVVTVGDRQTMIVLQGFRDKLASGLNTVAGRTADRNETTWQGEIFATGKPTTVVCTVRGTAIHVTCDGREIINWSGMAADLSLDLRYWANVPRGKLAVTIYDSNVLWRVWESRLERLGQADSGSSEFR